MIKAREAERKSLKEARVVVDETKNVELEEGEIGAVKRVDDTQGREEAVEEK